MAASTSFLDRLTAVAYAALDLLASAPNRQLLRCLIPELLQRLRPGEPGIWRLVEPDWATVVYLGGPHMGQKRFGPLRGYRFADTENLGPGVVLLGAVLSTGERAMRVQLRPPLSMHGGFTRGVV